MRLAVLALVACTLALGAAAGTLPLLPNYTCDPAKCLPANNCRCASMEPPLPRDQMPQFVLFTHDDGIVPAIYSAITATVGSRKNPNGCGIPLTWFTIKYDTEGYGCDLVQKLWKDGHEIALHTANHVRLDPPLNQTLIDEITGVRTWLNKTCKIPLEDMVGMRDPFLINNPDTRKAQHDAGYLYDSTINEHWVADGSWPTSKDGGSRLWPYSMDSGIPQNCDFAIDGHCTPEERYPGLWEVPVWVLQTRNYPMDAYSMDPSGDVFALLKLNFDAAYAGNRAPIPIYMHRPWMAEEANQKYVKQFMDYVLAKDDVWFVTMHQLIDWIRNPIPASEMKEKFNAGCKPGGSGAITTMSLDTSSPAATPTASPAAPSSSNNNNKPVAATPTPSPAAPAGGVDSTSAPPPSSAALASAAPASLAAAALAALALALLV